MNKIVQTVVVAAMLGSSMWAAAVAEGTPGDTAFKFDIPAQRLDTALTEFAQATGLQLLFPSNVAMDRAAPHVTGSLTPEKALQLLLKDSGLSYHYINAKTVAIRTKEGPPIASNATGG